MQIRTCTRRYSHPPFAPYGLSDLSNIPLFLSTLGIPLSRILNATHPHTCTRTVIHIFLFLTSFRLPHPPKLNVAVGSSLQLGPKGVEEELGFLLPLLCSPIAPCSSPSQAVPPNRYLNVRIISAWPGLRPGPWGPLGWRSRVPGGPHGVGGAPGFPWCQYLRPSAGSWSLLPVRPGHSAGSGGEKGGWGRSSSVLFIAQSLRVGASGTMPFPTPMRTHINL